MSFFKSLEISFIFSFYSCSPVFLSFSFNFVSFLITVCESEEKSDK